MSPSCHMAASRWIQQRFLLLLCSHFQRSLSSCNICRVCKFQLQMEHSSIATPLTVLNSNGFKFSLDPKAQTSFTLEGFTSCTVVISSVLRPLNLVSKNLIFFSGHQAQKRQKSLKVVLCPYLGREDPLVVEVCASDAGAALLRGSGSDLKLHHCCFFSCRHRGAQ